MIFDLEEMEQLRKHDKAVCFSGQLLELALKIAKSYSFKDLFVCSEEAQLARLACSTA